MTDYSTLKGLRVRTLSTDTIASQAVGGSWASGGTMNTARNAGNLGSVGLQTAALGFGGYTSGGLVGNTESYNGTSFTEENDLNQTTYYQAGFGLQTAAISAGGNIVTGVPPGESAKTESYDGTSWTEVNDLGSGRYNFAGIGVSGTAGIVVAGNNYPPNFKAFTESWDGTNWTEVGDVNTARRAVGGFGTSTAAIAATGNTGSPTTLTESWNGTSWTEITEVNTGRNWSVGSGTQTSGIIFGGDSPTFVANTEFWDGSSWTELADLSAGVSTHMGSGQSSYSALSFGGSAPSRTAASEEWTAPADFDAIVEGEIFYNTTANAIKANKLTFGTGAWATGGSLNTSRFYAVGAGTQTAAITSSGYAGTGSPVLVNAQGTELYDGSSWTEVNNSSDGAYGRGMFGSQTSAILAAGQIPPVSSQAESWDGTNWTEISAVNTARRDPGGFGSGNTSGNIIGGQYSTSIVAINENWNGTSWTEEADMNTIRQEGGGIGNSASAGLAVGGWTGSEPRIANVELWNGTSWTEVNDLNAAKANFAESGTSTSGIIAGGNTPAPGEQATTESWDGTSWTEVADLSLARTASGGAGSSNGSALVFGGYITGASPTFRTETEEWTVPSSITVKSITVS